MIQQEELLDFVRQIHLQNNTVQKIVNDWTFILFVELSSLHRPWTANQDSGFV